MKMFSNLKTAWRLLKNDVKNGAKRQLEREKRLTLLGAYNVFIHEKGIKARQNLNQTLFFLEKPVYSKSRPLLQQLKLHKNVRAPYRLENKFNENVKTCENLSREIEKKNLKDYIQWEQWCYRNDFKEKVATEEYEMQMKLYELEYDFRLKLPKLYSKVVGIAIAQTQKIIEEKVEEEVTETKAEAEFSLEDAMRVLGIASKPTQEELEKRLGHVVALNDPDKGGSTHLQEIAKTAAECIRDALGKPDVPFPEVKT